MTREWKPGDVAIRSYFDREQVSLFVSCHNKDHDLAGRYHWHHQSGGFDAETEPPGPAYRPLVVIDPESSDVNRLIHLLGTAARGSCSRFREVLREFANPKPPKPDEPTGLGAVVVTHDGELYVRDKTTTTVAHWKRASGGEGGKRHRYDDLGVISVLNHGVEPLADWERELLSEAEVTR